MPNANPQRAAFVTPGKLYVAEYFRETVRPVVLGAAPPFTLAPEIPLSHAGVPLVPLQDLSHADNGEWLVPHSCSSSTARRSTPTNCWLREPCPPVRAAATGLTTVRQTIPLVRAGADRSLRSGSGTRPRCWT